MWLQPMRGEIETDMEVGASYLCYMHVGNAIDCHAGHQEVSRQHTRGESEATIVHRGWGR